MCARYIVLTEEENEEIKRIIKEIEDKYGENKVKTGEIFPKDIAPVIINKNGSPSSEIYRWGYPGFNNKGLIINARGETLSVKPMFKKSFLFNRCLIPANGFFEWKSVGKRKEKYLIRTKNSNMFYMAGLYNTFNNNEGESYNAFVVITTDANKEMSTIHDRMPVILDEGEAEAWIGKNKLDINLLNSVLRPYESLLELEKQ